METRPAMRPEAPGSEQEVFTKSLYKDLNRNLTRDISILNYFPTGVCKTDKNDMDKFDASDRYNEENKLMHHIIRGNPEMRNWPKQKIWGVVNDELAKLSYETP